MKLAATHTSSFAQTNICLEAGFFLAVSFWGKVGSSVFLFLSYPTEADSCSEPFPERYAHSTTSVRTPLFSALLPLWLINPLSIIWSQSITPFYRLSGGITISLSGAPLRMADPYQTEATPWTKEWLWSSLHSATDVSISIGCSCCMAVWTGLRFFPLAGSRRGWWIWMIQFRLQGYLDWWRKGSHRVQLPKTSVFSWAA